MIKLGSHVITPHGTGIVVDEEPFDRCPRWGVKLDVSGEVKYYFKELVSLC